MILNYFIPVSKDWAEAMRELSGVYYPPAEVIIVVLDNLKTHSPASFIEAHWQFTAANGRIKLKKSLP